MKFDDPRNVAVLRPDQPTLLCRRVESYLTMLQCTVLLEIDPPNQGDLQWYESQYAHECTEKPTQFYCPLGLTGSTVWLKPCYRSALNYLARKRMLQTSVDMANFPLPEMLGDQYRLDLVRTFNKVRACHWDQKSVDTQMKAFHEGWIVVAGEEGEWQRVMGMWADRAAKSKALLQEPSAVRRLPCSGRRV